MSQLLTHEEHLDLLACIRELHAARSLAEFPQCALRALALLVPSNLSAFNEVNLPRNRIVAITDRPVATGNDLVGVWERHSSQHPMFRYANETGDGQALKFSDFLTEAEYHRLELYRGFYRGVNAEDQFSIVVRSDGGVLIAVAFNRPHRDFTESDRAKLNLVRPHLVQAYANLEELAGHVDEKNDLQTALRESGHGLIAVDGTGTAAHATPGADACLGRYFPVTEPLRTLPRPILDWLERDPSTPFVAEARDSKLIVRNPRNSERRLLLLSEESHRHVAPSKRLTARETEVLRWLSEGKSNAEIATILDIAAGTVKLHVEHILAKLDAPNRAAAVRAAYERGLLVTK